MDFDADRSLKEWAKDKPLSILQLDPADRAVLRIAGMYFTVTLILLNLEIRTQVPVLGTMQVQAIIMADHGNSSPIFIVF